MDDMILEIRHLSKSFGSHEVLRDIDFTVKKACSLGQQMFFKQNDINM